MKDFQVMGNRLLIEPDATGGKSAGGLYIPDTVDQRGPKWATVAAVSAGYYAGNNFVKPYVKEGDRILFDELGAIKVKVDGRDYWLVRNDDIIGARPSES